MEPALEKRLIQRARDKGDMRAFELLYRAFAADLTHRVIRPRVASDADAEDVLVDTFTTALAKLDTFSWQGRSIFHWLARIAANRAMDLGRERARRLRLQTALASEQLPSAPRPGPADSLLAAADDDERKVRIMATLEVLNPRYRAVIQQRLVMGRSRQDCADHLGVKLGTFDVLFLRAVRSFRKRWVERYGEEKL